MRSRKCPSLYFGQDYIQMKRRCPCPVLVFVYGSDMTSNDAVSLHLK